MKNLLHYSISITLIVFGSCSSSHRISKSINESLSKFSNVGAKYQSSELNKKSNTGRTFYISSNGNDVYDGLNISNPIRTIKKVKTLKLKPGDKVLFQCGGIWREQFDLMYSGNEEMPITIGCYGEGPKPIITGSDVIKNWNQYKGKIWSTETNQLEVPWWTVVVEGNKLFKPVYSEEELKKDGQFFIDKKNRKLMIFCSDNPNKRHIETSKRQHCININGHSNINIEDIQIKHAGHYGIMFRGYQQYGNCTVKRCLFKQNFYGGVLFMEKHGHNTVADCKAEENGNGFYAVKTESIIFSSDTVINNIAYSDKGFVTDGHGFGLFRSKDCIVESCYGDKNEGGSLWFDPDADNHAGPNGAIIRNNFFKNGMNSSACIGIQEVAPNSSVFIYNNLIINDDVNGPKGFAIYSGFKIQGNLYVFNNTIIQKKTSYRAVTFRYGDNVYFFNNVIVNDQKEGSAFEITYGGNIFSDCNIFYSPHTPALINYNGKQFKNINSWKVYGNQDKSSTYKELGLDYNSMQYKTDNQKFIKLKGIEDVEEFKNLNGVGYINNR